MTIRIQLQIVRKGTKYESYRVTIPRAIIKAHDLEESDFNLEFKGKKLILTPVDKE